jgi:predicted helicase
MTFNEVLQKYRDASFSELDKGDRFERLMKAYLQTDPKYAHTVETVWLWEEFPHRDQFGNHDIGIDLVVLTDDQEYWAVQCKCYAKDARIDKASVDTFLSTSGRDFTDSNDNQIRFTQRLWISTTNNWSTKAEETLKNQNPPVIRLNLSELQEAPVDWEKIDKGVFGEKARREPKTLRPHQKEALTRTVEHFEENDRGKLIMACGTGKTFTSLRIAEKVAGQEGVVLFLVPSIALLGQTLREWTADADEPINPICICSDRKVTRQNADDGGDTVIDLALPASTDVNKIVQQLADIESEDTPGLTVVFSTYQSIDVIAQTQKKLKEEGSKYSQFDLIVCDEAHRTTGIKLKDDDESTFIKVHDNNFLEAKKRLYMTATPRLYGEDSKHKAQQTDTVLCSMDDEKLYGKEMFRIGFGEAVQSGLLSDYKVLILTLSEEDVTPAVQDIVSDSSNEINTDDVSKLIGCVNAMSKQILGDEGILDKNDPEPMRRAVAFCPTIAQSKKITDTFNITTGTYVDSLPELKKKQMVNLQSDHIDGSMSATERDQLMSWLKEEPEDENESRVLTNVRCLSEGVDVPSLDAVMFLSARNSQVDVVQSVGRVMRISPGKQYGYIIIPVIVPTGVEPEKALDDNDRYKVVWTVLNALRAHDDRFNAIVNKIDLNKKRPTDKIMVGRVDPDGDGDPSNDSETSRKTLDDAENQTIALRFNELQNVIYAKLVQKVGDRLYWDNFTKSIADVAEHQLKRITTIVGEGQHKEAFDAFIQGLRKNINPSITEQQAIEMLSQHIITKPVFEALFEGYSFVQNNAVSTSMQHMMDVLDVSGLNEEDQKKLDEFYSFIKRRAAGIDNAEAKQRIIVEIYDKFFKVAFPKMVEQLGIVYTPIEVVDFIIHSVNDVLKQEFGRSLSDKNVNILDPFTGTGTFVTRLLQSGVIKPEDLERKYKHEIFANEIVLLAYYIAAVNIENTYHDLSGKDEYDSFEGIVLTDTFQLGENEDKKLFSDTLLENTERGQRQKETPLPVIIGNPPYSIGQKSENDDAQNQKYPILDSRISETYVAESNSTMNKALYDAYVKAIRWSTDRLSSDGGIVAFVSNGSWLDGNSTSGLRKSLEKEFSSIYVFNLRGNQRTQGEESKREGGKIFGSGSRTPISITLLVKNPDSKNRVANIRYHDIGDYLSQKQKLSIVSSLKSVANTEMSWEKLSPNSDGDWINARNTAYNNLLQAYSTPEDESAFFSFSTSGILTSRDTWVYNYSKSSLQKNVSATINFYTQEVKEERTELNNDPANISWSRGLKQSFQRGKKIKFVKSNIRVGLYRPFTKQNLYFGRDLNEVVYKQPSIIPESDTKNLQICLTGKSAGRDFSVLITDVTANFDTIEKSRCLPLYYYEKIEPKQDQLFREANKDQYERRDGVSDFIWNQSKKRYGSEVSKEDIFFYVYGLLHSPDYRNEFSNDLKKMLPRLPLVTKKADFWAFSKAGRDLAALHVDYEEVPACEDVQVSGTQHGDYQVEKMKIPKVKGVQDKNTVVYNDKIKIEGIPEKAYEYVVNGRSPIEWIIDRYQVKTDKASGITNDPNDWGKEVGNERYILDLLLSVINLSVQTVDIVNSLPKLTFAEQEK